MDAVKSTVSNKRGEEFFIKNAVYYYKILHLVWSRAKRRNEFGFAKIHSLDFRKTVWARLGTLQLANVIKRDLIESGILECDKSWYHGGDRKAFSLGYKFADKYVPKFEDLQVIDYVEPTNIRKRIEMDEECRKHVESLKKIKVDHEGALGFIKYAVDNHIRIKDDDDGKPRYMTSEIAAFWYLQVFDIIHKRFWFTKHDVVGRVFSNITNFPSMLRKYLNFGEAGDSDTVDVVNSQPLIINAVMKRAGAVDPAYKIACESGTFYESMAEVLPDISRDALKTSLFKFVIFGGSTKNPVMDRFGEKYPQAYQFLKDRKGKDAGCILISINQYGKTINRKVSGNVRFAIDMQRMEADIMLAALRDVNDLGITAVGIHDAIHAPKEHIPKVKLAIAKRFYEHDLVPMFK